MYHKWFGICCALIVACASADVRMRVSSDGVEFFAEYTPQPGASISEAEQSSALIITDGSLSVETDKLNPFFDFPEVPYTEPTNGYPIGLWWQHSADALLYPHMTGRVDVAESNEPVIYEWTRSADNGDTIIVTGENIDANTSFYVIDISLDQGYRSLGTVVSAGDNYAAIRLSGDEGWYDQVLFIWPKNAEGFGNAIVVNKAEAWWIGPDVVHTGETFSVYGRNLKIDDTRSYVWIDGYGWLATTDCSPYKATFEVPDSLTNGTYSVYAHNGQADRYGWSDGIELVVASPIDYTVATNTVTAGNFSSLKSTIEGASAGTTIEVPAGTYAFTSRIDGSDVANNVWIKGAGAGSTIFVPDATLSDTRMLNFGNDVPNSSGPLAEKVTGMKITGITFDSGDGSPRIDDQIRVYGDRVVIDGCDFVSTNIASKSVGNVYNIATFTGSENGQVTVKNCNFYNYKPIGLRNFVQFIGNNVYGIYDSSKPIETYGGRNVDISNCSNNNFSTNDLAGWGYGSGRFFVAQQKTMWHYYIGENATTNMKPRFDPALEWYNQGSDQNAAEQILYEDTRPEYIGLVESATTNTLGSEWLKDTVSGYEFYAVTIVDGKGFGQTRPISSINETTGVATLFENWNVTPDTASTFTLHKCGWRSAVVNNELDGRISSNSKTASAGISLYGGPNEWVVASNTITKTESGILVWGYSDTGWTSGAFTIPNYAETTYFNIIDGNSVSNMSGRLLTTEPYDYGKHAYEIRYRGSTSSYSPMVSVLGTIFRDNLFYDANTSLSLNNEEPTMVFAGNVFEFNTGTATNGFVVDDGENTYKNGNSITILE